MDLADVEAVDYTRYGALITAGTVFAAEPSRSATFPGLRTGAGGGPADHLRHRLPALFLAVAAGRGEVLSRAGAMAT
jgi:5-dehydro-2-deoxygluconokinase